MNIVKLHQIELTSRCNLSCVYCINPKMPRGHHDMSWETYLAALDWVKHFVKSGTQFELNLAGVGESTIHPRFVEAVLQARSVMGPNRRITIATNGLAVTDQMAEAISLARPEVWVSLHRPERAMRGVAALRKYGLLREVTVDPAINPNDWAGQVEWAKPVTKFPCPWLRQGMGFVTALGDVLTCCLDGTGESRVGSVFDPPGVIWTSHPYGLCTNCYQEP